jgi:ketosteroid isomerase-like protein
MPEEFLDAGDETVVVLGRYHGVAKGTERRLDVPFVHVWTLEAGKAVRFRQFLDTAGWVEALRG